MDNRIPEQSVLLRPSRPATALVLLLCLCAFFAGCSRFRHLGKEVVYVNARQTYLHDRVAAVSNRVAMVTNGQRLEVIEHGRRFLRVKTEKNEIGWIVERAVVDTKTADAFEQMAKQHRQEPVVATATLRDDLYLHLLPGRASQHFYLLSGNAKVELLERASVVRTQPNGAPLPKPVVVPPPMAAKPGTAAQPGKPATSTAAGKQTAATPAPSVAPPPMEDWWLARDAQGRTGWLLASRVDVDVPDSIGIFAEGQRTIGAWVVAKVYDPESSTADHMVPEYVTMLAPPKSGLPFDFDQVRVFTWSLKRHRYETSFRLHPIQGYLPIQVTPQQNQGGPASFSFQIAGDSSLVTDHATGVTRPVHPRTISFQLIDTRVVRTGPDFGPIPIQHDPEDNKAGADGKKGSKGKKK